ncbi:hypothetical protein Tco_1091644 [Tanacetum coccineum]|uniref:Uncharacterized protein n=1 Tax=Tanacetum coccineum TaxID=301880 RepID=A0ABQ5I7R4_9ASTR
MANEPNEVRGAILRRLRTEQENEVTLANNLFGEMTRYLLQMRSRAEEDTRMHSLPLDQPLNSYGLHTLRMSSESDTCITTAFEAAREEVMRSKNSSTITEQSKSLCSRIVSDLLIKQKLVAKVSHIPPQTIVYTLKNAFEFGLNPNRNQPQKCRQLAYDHRYLWYLTCVTQKILFLLGSVPEPFSLSVDLNIKSLSVSQAEVFQFESLKFLHRQRFRSLEHWEISSLQCMQRVEKHVVSLLEGLQGGKNIALCQKE